MNRSKLVTIWCVGACLGLSGCVVDDALGESDSDVGVAESELFQSCSTTYSPPAMYPPIDPVALLGGTASDCVVGTNDSPCAPHHVYGPNPVREREPLFVFLPGTNMEPDKHDLVLMTAASTGYRSIGLSYDNTVSAGDACAGQEACGLNCRGDMREEVIRGVNVSANVAVARGDSILVRLYRVLENLDATDPGGGWSSYYVPTAGNINSTNILWDTIIFGGFSQGAGHAARLSRVRQVHGLFVLDGANDTCIDALGNDVPSEWITTGIDASAGRPKYGFRHDHGTGDTTTSASWDALGFGTSLTSIDCALPGCDVIDMVPPPHASVTAQGHPVLPAICSNHMSMARDACMPTDVAGATAAAAAADSRLFEPYARRLCYACDIATCP
jgi:hypothetical protein